MAAMSCWSCCSPPQLFWILAIFSDNILQDVEAKLEAAEELHKTVGFAELYEYADTDPSAHPKELLKLACRPNVQQS